MRKQYAKLNYFVSGAGVSQPPFVVMAVAMMLFGLGGRRGSPSLCCWDLALWRRQPTPKQRRRRHEGGGQ